MEPLVLPTGLALAEEALSSEFEEAVLDEINGRPWNKILKRWTQHYGYEYDYAARSAVGRETVPMPYYIANIAQQLSNAGIFGEGVVPNQCIVNRYLRGQSIGPHTDALTFGPVVVSVSLGSPAVMVFSRQGHHSVPIYLRPRSVLVMSGEARDIWKHEIPGRITIDEAFRPYLPLDIYTKQPDDYCRISLTYRTLPQ